MDKNEKVLITGINGFIGSFLAKNLKNKGFEIYGISSSNKENRFCNKIFIKKLGEPIEDIFKAEDEKIDYVIHTAYTEKKEDYEKNYTGTIEWASYFKRLGVKKQIFLSSISARADSVSQYGIIKEKTDSWFLNNKLISLRLGLVIGNGGMMKKILSLIRERTIIPVIGGNRFKIYITSLDSILCSVLKLIDSEINSGLFYLHNSKHYGNKEFLHIISKSLSKKRLFIPVPYSLAFLLISMLSLLKIKIPGNININNIKGLKQNSNFSKSSDLGKLGCKEENLKTILVKVFK